MVGDGLDEKSAPSGHVSLGLCIVTEIGPTLGATIFGISYFWVFARPVAIGTVAHHVLYKAASRRPPARRFVRLPSAGSRRESDKEERVDRLRDLIRRSLKDWSP